MSLFPRLFVTALGAILVVFRKLALLLIHSLLLCSESVVLCVLRLLF